VIGLDASGAVLVSAKQGIGIHEVLEAIVHLVPPPKGSPDDPLRALIFDSWFDPYRGVIILVRVIDGRLRMRQKIKLWSNGQVFEVEGLVIRPPRRRPPRISLPARSGICTPTLKPCPTPRSGTPSPMPRIPRPSLCPASKKSSRWYSRGSIRWNRTSIRCCATRSKSCASTTVPSPSSRKIRSRSASAFAAGLLGLLHLEIVQERLEREFNIDLITTAPGVRYRITRTDGEVVEVENPTKFPDPSYIAQIDEPIIDATVITREEYLGGVLALLEEKRGVQKKFEYIGSAA
jgi:GTP-binding protein LepA